MTTTSPVLTRPARRADASPAANVRSRSGATSKPIACTPQDALRCLWSSGLDALAIEGLWVGKP